MEQHALRQTRPFTNDVFVGVVVDNGGPEEGKVGVVETAVEVGGWVDETASEGLRRYRLWEGETGVKCGEFGGGESEGWRRGCGVLGEVMHGGWDRGVGEDGDG